MEAARILGMRVDPIGYEQVLKKVFAWAEAGESRYVCVANAGVEAYTGMDVLG
jgi:N-acetylglucosaminyldiphosphoundecaprenol N-acetyl-beta-D-mannosaminyltransferase